MFWTDWGVVDKIERATLAGEDRQTLIASPQRVYRPTGITVDYVGDRSVIKNSNLLNQCRLIPCLKCPRVSCMDNLYDTNESIMIT